MYIAEISCNHGGNYDVCCQMFRDARRAGADVVKIQLFTPDQMTRKRYSPRYVIPDGPWKGRDLYGLYEEAMTPKEWLPHLQDLAVELGVGLMVSVFHPDMVLYCEDYEVEMYKVASPEVGYRDLLEELDFVDKPVFVSTGLATRDELKWIHAKIGNLTFLHCVTEYPASVDECNLLTLLDLAKFKVPVGLSDHSKGLIAPVAATVLGASVIEKHFKITDDCLDAEFSLNPVEFNAMVQACEATKDALGAVSFKGTGRYKRRLVDGDFIRVVE